MTRRAYSPELRKCSDCWISKRRTCPIRKADPKTTGCNYDREIMVQIICSMRAKSKPFEDVCKELGI